jgi:predicted O-methyltransferase YrrM
VNPLISRVVSLADVCLLPLVYPSALVLKLVRAAGVQRLPLCKNALLNVGVFPIRQHFYEPQFDMRKVKRDFSQERALPGIDWNATEQLQLVKQFMFGDELRNLPARKSERHQFHFNNGLFESGDAEFWYQLIRYKKPGRILEIGSGYSTLVAIDAIEKNKQENPDYECRHVCIEPYERHWLEEAGVEVIREKVEDVKPSCFSKLSENDILFIDSSHIIRPDGDVVFEYLELLPRLNVGVIVHVHDIFSPRNYLDEWLRNEVRFWNEQYLLEAFLSHNRSWKVIGALNYLRHNHFDELKQACPFLTEDREPGSFYIQRVA